ncbi:MAG: Uma2 family endonuclease [Myxococcales bacterium]|nr:Uma2 family endonuclease [Myxococcales bacterium]
MSSPKEWSAPGPFYAHQVRPGDRYEVSNGNAIYCAPTGGDGARGTVAGLEVLDTDPEVEAAGVDAGYTPRPKTLRAPDIALGNVPDEPGWIQGVPPLAVEYASAGQDEAELQAKIAELLEAGTRILWVVRLLGPRRVEVYERDRAMRTLGPGEELHAPGILRNAVPVEAMYDRTVAHELTLRNLLQRRGYETLDAVREEGREEGRAQALLEVLRARGLPVEAATEARILAQRDPSVLSRWLGRAIAIERVEDLFGD